jgi:hypothetical protein
MISLHKVTFASKLRLTRMQSEGEKIQDVDLAFCNQGKLTASSKQPLGQKTVRTILVRRGIPICLL